MRPPETRSKNWKTFLVIGTYCLLMACILYMFFEQLSC